MVRSALLAAAVMGVAGIAQAGALGVFTENTGHATDSSFIAGAASAPYGWLSPVGDTSKVWEIYRKRVSGSANSTAANPDVALTNAGNVAQISNEFFGVTGTNDLTDLGMVFGVAAGTASQPLAMQSYSNQGMEFRVGFMQRSKVGTGWLAGVFGDNRIGNMSPSAWGACQDPANTNNGADTMFLKLKFNADGTLNVNNGFYTHSGTDLLNGEANLITTGIGSGSVGTGMQPMSWSITDTGSDTATFAFSWGGYSYSLPGVSLTADVRSTSFGGAGGKLDLTDTVPFIYVGGASWGTAGLDGAVAVPEPATLGVLALGAIGLLHRRRA